MKKLILLLLCLPLVVAQAQTAAPDSVKYWKIGGNTSFTFNQVSLTNWAAGGQNSLAGTFLINSHFNYKKEKVSWDNVFDIGYGLTKQGSDNPFKTEDKLYMVSKFGYSAGKKWYYSALFDFKTQMDVGYKDPPKNTIKISDFMTPAYLNLSLGMDYKPSDNFSLYMSPLTTKMTIVLDDSLASVGAFGVEKGKNLREEYGALIKISANKSDIVKNVDVKTRLDLFSNLTQNPENIDVDWEIVFNMKVNKWLSAVASFNLIYDDDINFVNDQGQSEGPKAQFKQLFGFGLSYKFGT